VVLLFSGLLSVRKNFLIRVIIFLACIGFMEQLVAEDKKMLVVYPMILFYTTLSWMVLLAASQ